MEGAGRGRTREQVSQAAEAAERAAAEDAIKGLRFAVAGWEERPLHQVEIILDGTAREAMRRRDNALREAEAPGVDPTTARRYAEIAERHQVLIHEIVSIITRFQARVELAERRRNAAIAQLELRDAQEFARSVGL
jgi:hypothetical protein